MTPERWVRIKEIFDEVIEAPESERDRVLGTACAGDDELASEMRKLLAEHASTEGFLDHPVFGSDTVFSPAPNLPALEPGQVLSQRFRIVRFIARGGMGEVYEAYDSELDEAVALKTIRSEIAADPRVVTQFRREVRQARKISSPHVCRVNDLFTHPLEEGRSLVYLTMQLLVGESLSERLVRRGRMDPGEALPLLRQMGEALEAAHRAGIIHRDFKSGNVMLVRREDGSEQAVITDFGLARPAVMSDLPSMRDAFNAAGTPAYMAPEQLEGKSLTIAADIFALGVVAYEMVTGQLPYGMQPPSGGARLNEAPPPPRSVVPDLDPRWDAAILRCLERHPALRFASATEVAASIVAPRVWLRLGRRQWVMAAVLIALVCIGVFLLALLRPQSPRAESVAVLPFETIGGKAESEYFADGITDEVIAALTKIRSLRVIARGSSFHYKGLHTKLSQVGRELRVTKIVTGTLQRSGGRLRIIASLVNASDGVQIWSEGFNGNEAELFDFQDKIARGIAAALQVNLAGFQVGVRSEGNPSLNAHDLYLWGLFHLNKRSDRGLQLALSYFKQSAASDPKYAAAYVGLADTYCVMAERGSPEPRTALPDAKQAAFKALALDPQMADVYASLGQISALYDRDFAEAERYFRKALELNPNLLAAHQWYSYMLLKLRRFDESLRHALLALDVDPLSNPANGNLAVLYFYMGKYDDALAQCRKMLELEPQHEYAPMLIALTLARQRRFEQAFEEFDKLSDNLKGRPWQHRVYGEIQAMAGNRREAEQVIRDLEIQKRTDGVPASFIAMVYATLGDKDRAFEWLERADAESDSLLSLLHVYPAYDSLRSDPRYSALLKKLGITGNMGSGSTRTL